MLKILVVVIALALAVYWVVRLLQARHLGSQPPVTGPDDDPDFLRGLGRQPDDDR